MSTGSRETLAKNRAKVKHALRWKKLHGRRVAPPTPHSMLGTDTDSRRGGPLPGFRVFRPPGDSSGHQAPWAGIWGVKNQTLQSKISRLLLEALIRRQKSCKKTVEALQGCPQICAKRSRKNRAKMKHFFHWKKHRSSKGGVSPPPPPMQC